jgi:hypothetical protein
LQKLEKIIQRKHDILKFTFEVVEFIVTNFLAKIVDEVKNGANKIDNIMGYP